MYRLLRSLLRRYGLTAVPPSPLDWAPAPDVGVESVLPAPPPAVDIVVPVAGAVDEFERLCATLRAHTDLRGHRLVLVLDGDVGSRLEAVATALRTDPETDCVVLRNPTRRGFVFSVNRGIERSRRDIVLLNSDTEVTSGWLDKLQRATYSAPRIATATPFSNTATICSLPVAPSENHLPAGWDTEAFAALVERCSQRDYPAVPTGVGVCLYIRRAAIDEIGVFSVESFDLGYGEESEFCFRALKAGWRHVVDDATFIYHAGQASFGQTRERRVKSAHRAMERIHPEYEATIAEFLRRDPLAAHRRRVRGALSASEGWAPTRLDSAKVVHLVHGWPPFNHAGTEAYARWLVLAQAEDGRPAAVYTRIGDLNRRSGSAMEYLDRGVRVRLLVNNFDQRNPAIRNGLRNRRLGRDFATFLDQERPDLVHIHHLSGHALNLAEVAFDRRLPVIFQLQDWWSLCARANLLDANNHTCPGPRPARCSDCLPLTALPPAAILNQLLYALRERLSRRIWRRYAALVMGSRFIADDFRRRGWIRDEDRIHVLPYGVPLAHQPPAAEVPPTRAPLTLGFVGSLMPHKGVHVLLQALHGLPAGSVRVELWGDQLADPPYMRRLEDLSARHDVRFRGRFHDADKARVLRSMDVLVVPSLGYESFGLVAREAMACGTPVIASATSALGELVENAAGTMVPPGDVEALAEVLRSLIDDPTRIDRWRRGVPPVKGFQEHLREIDGVYRSVLAEAPMGR